ncbi:MAG: SLBB domain-containing protein, partial [Limnospira sp.]
VNLRELLENGDLSQDLALRDGDTIRVPTAEFLDPIAIRQINSASFAPEAIAPFPVVVVGEVFNPGTHIMGQQPGMVAPGDLGEPPTITQAIKLAGGITPSADLRKIELQRLSQAGEMQTLEVDLWQLLKTGDATQDVTLQPGDAIVIPTARRIDPADIASLASASFSPATMLVNVVGEVEQPGSIEVPIDTTLNQAILVAGGFDARRANMSSVDLLRLNPNGTVSRRQIKIDFQAGINESNNPILRRNDVVVIRRSALTQVGDGLEEVFRPVGGLIGVANILNIINTLTEDDDNNNN